jgi:hypothetical protein
MQPVVRPAVPQTYKPGLRAPVSEVVRSAKHRSSRVAPRAVSALVPQGIER